MSFNIESRQSLFDLAFACRHPAFPLNREQIVTSLSEIFPRYFAEAENSFLDNQVKYFEFVFRLRDLPEKNRRMVHEAIKATIEHQRFIMLKNAIRLELLSSETLLEIEQSAKAIQVNVMTQVAENFGASLATSIGDFIELHREQEQLKAGLFMKIRAPHFILDDKVQKAFDTAIRTAVLNERKAHSPSFLERICCFLFS